MTQTADLIQKYDVPAPRYTSYPTVPYWETSPTPSEWITHVDRALAPDDSSIAVYLHIPFCETLCTFCGCNTSITRDHSVEEPYIHDLLREFQMYLDAVPQMATRELRELHLGGGSPTYLSPQNLERLCSSIIEQMSPVQEPEFSIEVDPRRTTGDQLRVLQSIGFSRISLGVQDFDPEVQRLINRHQPLEATERVTDQARELGYTSVNFDLIYGLPRQTIKSMETTVEETIRLRPDRIALYSYAHVPWIKASQRLFTEDDLPRGEAKRELYEMSRRHLTESGYREIGMDHFALPDDPLALALDSGEIHRNFMGYTSRRTDLLLGLGVSAISDSWDCFHQNEKVTKKYQKFMNEGQLATLRGHRLNEEDLMVRRALLETSTRFRARLHPQLLADARESLVEMERDGLVTFTENELIVTDAGRPFLRNICMGLDLRLKRHRPEARVFSQSI